MRSLTGSLVTAAATLAVLTTGLPESPAPADTPTTMRPCPREDSRGCYWDAATRGNGRGTSFVNMGGIVVPLTSTDRK